MRRGGLAFIVVVFVGALARMWTPQTSAVTPSQGLASAASSPSEPQKASTKTASTPKGSLQVAIQEKIRTFFAEPVGTSGTCVYVANYCVPKDSRNGIRFVVAIVPDPVHSHLAHFFDEAIEAIEQGAFNEGYIFDRALMPWPYASPAIAAPSTGTITLNVSASGIGQPGRTGGTAEIPQDFFPGLLIFRESEIRLNLNVNESAKAHPAANRPAWPLFVFIVGETPTAGINEDQFRYAAQIIHQIRTGTDQLAPADEPDFGIVGPTFSGSLYSLRAVLQQYLTTYSEGYAGHPNRVVPLYGTVLGTSTIKWFQHTIPEHVRMVLFQQDSATVLNTFFQFVNNLGYGKGAVAILSEDETAYGSTGLQASALPRQSAISADEELNLFFPRGISEFRSEYAKEISGAANGSGTGNPRPTNLRLDLETTGSDDDSVAPYAKPQTPITQESVMVGIVSELRQHEAKFVMLRATDPLDELFLAHYLHDKYSQGRIVVPTPDLLFAREGDVPLDGVLGLNTYPLVPSLPDPLNPLCKGFGGWETFGAAHSVAAYNATTALIQRLDELKSKVLAAPPGPMDQSPCRLSPHLWLTMVSRNVIRPLRILYPEKPAEGSPLFPKSTDAPPHERDQRDQRVPLWVFAYIVCIGAMFRHGWLSWTGGEFGLWMTARQFRPPGKPNLRKAWLLCLGGIVLAAMLAILVSVWIPVVYAGNERWAWGPLIVFVGLTAWDLWHRRREPGPAVLFILAAAGVAVAGIFCARHAADAMVLWQQRTLDLASGASLATPVLFLLIGAYCWFWYALRAEALTDWRCPQLPTRDQLPTAFYRLGDNSAEVVRTALHQICTPWWVVFGSIVAVLSFAVPAAVVTPGHAPIRSLEGPLSDIVYSTVLGLAIVLLLATLLRLISVWRRFVKLLTPMDRDGMRNALERLTGFEWNVIWNPAWSVKNEGYKMLSREIQILERLQESLETKDPAEPASLKNLRDRVQSVMSTRADLVRISVDRDKESEARVTQEMMENYVKLQTDFAATGGSLCESYLYDYWKRTSPGAKKGGSDHAPEGASTVSVDLGAISATVNLGDPTSKNADPSGLSLNSLRLAEEFVASVYANFLVTVLLAVRGLVFTAVVVYACIVLSTISYPFQPAPDLTMLAVVLFAFGGVVIWYVYEEMHRDPTLSRMTSTEPGKLDAAFWTKFASAGIVPVIALVTTVYPPFGHVLYTLVAPLLQAIR